MIRLPYIESACAHGGDLRRLAEWLLDYLDRQPPIARAMVGDACSATPTESLNLTLYLCYHPDDQAAFAATGRSRELARAMLAVYQREKQMDGLGYGDLLFDLTRADEDDSLRLIFRKGAQQAAPVLIEFCWHPTTTQAVPGLFGLVSRRDFPAAIDQTMRALLRVEPSGAIAHHLDRWQRAARWHQAVVYLPHAGKTLLAGAEAGCDLYVPQLPAPLAITYDGTTDEWKLSAPVEAWLAHSREQGSFAFAYRALDGKAIFEMRGELLEPPRSLAELESENRPDSFQVEVLGCLLPLPPPDGYGIVPTDAPSAIKGRTRTAIRLPDGNWLHFDEIRGFPCLFDGGDPQGKQLKPGVSVVLNMTAPSGQRYTGRWQEFQAPRQFYGEFQLHPPLLSILARGAIDVGVPNELFADYADSTLGRPPLRIVSDDGRHYKLVFNAHARLPIEYRQQWHYPDGSSAIPLDPQSQFTLGATHYQLRKQESGSAALQIELARGV